MAATSAPTNGGTAQNAPPQTYWQPLNIGQLLNLPPKQWLIDGVLGVGDLGMLYGAPGSGKSFIALDMAFSLCLGRAWAGSWDLTGAWIDGFAITKPCIVFYCTGEGISGLGNRMRALVDFHQAQPAGFYAFADVPQLGQSFKSNPLGIQQYAVDLKTMIADGALPTPDLIIIDTFASASTGVKENDPSEQNTMLNGLRVVMKRLDCAVLLVHHTNKAGLDERGSTAPRGTADTMLMVKANGEHIIESTKIKDGPLLPAQRFELKTWLQSCVVRWDGASTAAKGASKAPTIADKVYTLLLQYPSRQFTVKELAAGVGGTDNATGGALQRLRDAGKAEQCAAPAGSKATWIWQLSSAIRAATP